MQPAPVPYVQGNRSKQEQKQAKQERKQAKQERKQAEHEQKQSRQHDGPKGDKPEHAK